MSTAPNYSDKFVSTRQAWRLGTRLRDGLRRGTAAALPKHLSFPNTQLNYALKHPRRIQMSKLGFSSDKFWLRFLAKVLPKHMGSIDWEGLGHFISVEQVLDRGWMPFYCNSGGTTLAT